MKAVAMGKKLALVIAVEKYADPSIRPVRFAEEDAKGFETALKLAEPATTILLLSAKATRTTILSQLKQQLKFLTADDHLYIFYAGHGFSRDGHNYITCHDTDVNDLEGTSIKLKELLNKCGQSACQRIALFLDSCESGITDIPDIRNIYGTMSTGELEEFFRASEYRTCFASCKTRESSYSSESLKHGVWSYHVIQALKGNAKGALEKGRYVTAASLQNYVSVEIPRTLKKVFSKPVIQTPWQYGSQNRDFVIADLDGVLRKKTAANPSYNQIKSIFLRFEESVKIASLSGFIKGSHRVPKNNSNATASFVERISQKDIDEAVESVFEEIRAEMKYKRNDITSNAGRIVTPDFEFWAECVQDSEDPEFAVMSRQLTNISPKIVDSAAFNKVFEDYFEDLTFTFDKGVDLGELIDQIEDLDDDAIQISYPPDSSYCDLTVEGSDLEIKITSHSLTVHSPKALAPKQLVRAFFDVQQILVGSPVLKALSAPAGK